MLNFGTASFNELKSLRSSRCLEFFVATGPSDGRFAHRFKAMLAVEFYPQAGAVAHRRFRPLARGFYWLPAQLVG